MTDSSDDGRPFRSFGPVAIGNRHTILTRSSYKPIATWGEHTVSDQQSLAISESVGRRIHLGMMTLSWIAVAVLAAVALGMALHKVYKYIDIALPLTIGLVFVVILAYVVGYLREGFGSDVRSWIEN